MVNSNPRKLLLSGWLKENGSAEYTSPLKLQKFLLFYEAFSKIDGDDSDFTYLKGYERGPVFSNVFGDYTHERESFDIAAHQEYALHSEQVNTVRAKRSHFIVSTLSAKELSSLTHKLNLWKSKENRIMNGERQVELDEIDFNEEDWNLVTWLEKMYPESLIENSYIANIDTHYFVFKKDDVEKLTAQHFDILSNLADNAELINPVYVELDEEGRLIVD